MIPFKKKKKNPIIRERTERILPSIIHHVSPRFSIVGHNRDTDFRKLRNSPECTKSAPCFSTSNTFVTFIATGSIATTDLHRPCEYKRKDIYIVHIYIERGVTTTLEQWKGIIGESLSFEIFLAEIVRPNNNDR